jgi:DNA-directed RNA polymerase subunit E'/Rpb7
MSSVPTGINQKLTNHRTRKLLDIYSKGLLTKKVNLSIEHIGSNLKETLEKKVSSLIEGKCITEGYIKEDSIKMITYSSGKIKNGNYIEFEVVFECEICLPVEGMLIDCKSKNITKAGIKADVDGEGKSPLIIFIARDHHYQKPYFATIGENENIKIRVIGQRFELNDTYISILGELIEPIDVIREIKKEPRIILEDEAVNIVIKKKRKPKLVVIPN